MSAAAPRPFDARALRFAAASFDTHLPNAFDLSAFVPYLALKGSAPIVFRSALHERAAFTTACFSAADAAARLTWMHPLSALAPFLPEP